MLPTTKSATLAIWKTDPTIPVERRSAALAALEGKTVSDSAPTHAAARVLRRGEVARRFQVSTRSIDAWSKSGLLQKVMLPGRHRSSGFRESDVAALIEGRTAGVGHE